MSEERIFHVVPAAELVWDADDRYRARSLAAEGFVHASYRAKVLESAKLYFPDAKDVKDLRVLAIVPSLLDVKVEVVDTPRGPMPHIMGPIPRIAATVLSIDDLA